VKYNDVCNNVSVDNQKFCC